MLLIFSKEFNGTCIAVEIRPAFHSTTVRTSMTRSYAPSSIPCLKVSGEILSCAKQQQDNNDDDISSNAATTIIILPS